MNDETPSISREESFVAAFMELAGPDLEGHLIAFRGPMDAYAESFDTNFSGNVVSVFSNASPDRVAASDAASRPLCDSIVKLKESAETLAAVLARVANVLPCTDRKDLE